MKKIGLAGGFRGILFVSLFLSRITGIQAFQDFLRNVINAIGVEQVVKTRIADNHAIAFRLVVLLQERVDGVAQLQAVLFILAQEFLLQLVA